MKCLDAKYYADVTGAGKFHSNVMLVTDTSVIIVH